MAKDGGIKFSKTGGGMGKVSPPPKEIGFSSEPALCVFGRFAWLSWHLTDRTGGKIWLATAMFFFYAPPPGYAVL